MFVFGRFLGFKDGIWLIILLIVELYIQICMECQEVQKIIHTLNLCNLAVSQPLVGRSLTAIRDEFAQLPVTTMTGRLPVSCHC